MTALFGNGAAAPVPKTQPNHVEGRVSPVCRDMEEGAPPPAGVAGLIGTGVVPAPGIILAARGAKEGVGGGEMLECVQPSPLGALAPNCLGDLDGLCHERED